MQRMYTENYKTLKERKEDLKHNVPRLKIIEMAILYKLILCIESQSNHGGICRNWQKWF